MKLQISLKSWTLRLSHGKKQSFDAEKLMCFFVLL